MGRVHTPEELGSKFSSSCNLLSPSDGAALGPQLPSLDIRSAMHTILGVSTAETSSTAHLGVDQLQGLAVVLQI